GQTAAAHALEQRIGHLCVLGLIRRDRMDVIDPLFVLVFVLVVDQFMGCSNDVALPFRQCLGVISAATATTSAALLALSVLLAERANIDEVHVRRDGIGRILGVYGLAVIRDDVAGLEVVFLEEERMAGRDFLRALTLARKQIDFLVRTAIYRVMQFKLAYAKVIIGTKLGKDFFNFRSFGIASGLGKFDDRLLIVQSFHRSLFKVQILLS